jgi:hypothetical protein
MVEVEIDSIRVSLMSQQRIVILKELDSERFLPIWIGPYEAEAITLSLNEVEVVRPLTHDLLRNIINDLGAQVLRVNITELRDDVFYARIILQVDGQEMSIDSRPSDALALSVRVHVPVFVDEEVMEAASTEPEEILKLRCRKARNLRSAWRSSRILLNPLISVISTTRTILKATSS